MAYKIPDFQPVFLFCPADARSDGIEYRNGDKLLQQDT